MKKAVVKEDVRTVAQNFTRLVEAICLLIVAGFGFWGAYNVPLRTEYKYAILFASVVIALRGAVEFLRHLNKRG